MKKKKVLKILGIIIAVAIGIVIALACLGNVAQAAGLVDSTIDKNHAYSRYGLDNYQLDFYVDTGWDWLPWNWGDGIGKSVMYGVYMITNFIWRLSLYISNATGYLVSEAFKLDFITKMAETVGKNIQTLAGGYKERNFYRWFLCWIFIVLYCDCGCLCDLYRAFKERNNKGGSCSGQFCCCVFSVCVIYCLCP